MTDLERIRAVTGITVDQIPDAELEVILDLADGMVLCAAADAADRMATSLIGGAGVTAVEDISMDRRRPIEAWRGLADRLRARCEREQFEDDGPCVVEFRPYGYSSGVEAGERG